MFSVIRKMLEGDVKNTIDTIFIIGVGLLRGGDVREKQKQVTGL